MPNLGSSLAEGSLTKLVCRGAVARNQANFGVVSSRYKVAKNFSAPTPQTHSINWSQPQAPIAQGIERRSPEAEAQVRFLLGAHDSNRT